MSKETNAKEILARNLQIVLRKKELKESDLNRLSGVATTTINNITNARYAANVEVLHKIAAALDVSFSALLNPDHESVELLSNYSSADNKRRKLILDVAEQVTKR